MQDLVCALDQSTMKLLLDICIGDEGEVDVVYWQQANIMSLCDCGQVIFVVKRNRPLGYVDAS